MLLSCIIRNDYCTLPRKIRREKTLGEMWAAVIRTINNLLRTVWLRTRAPQMGTEPESVDAQKGTMKDVFARCLKKNEAQVCTLLKTCAYRKEEFQPYCKYHWKTNIWDLHWSHYWCTVYTYTYSYQHVSSFIFSHVQDMSYNNRCYFS